MKKIVSIISLCFAVIFTFYLVNAVAASETYYNLGSSTTQATRFEAEDYMSSDAKIATNTSTSTGYTLASGNTVVEMGNPASAVMTMNASGLKETMYTKRS